jgi:hypothetical protein
MKKIIKDKPKQKIEVIEYKNFNYDPDKFYAIDCNNGHWILIQCNDIKDRLMCGFYSFSYSSYVNSASSVEDLFEEALEEGFDILEFNDYKEFLNFITE